MNGQARPELDKLRAPVAGMRTERVDIEDVTGVPLDGDTEGLRFLLDTPASIARIEDERLDVGGEVKDAVHMGFDVVVERVMRLSAWEDGWVSIGELGQGVPVGDPKVLRLEDAVRIAKRGPRECVRGKPDVG